MPEQLDRPRPWNADSGVLTCSSCDGAGAVWNGRGKGGNDPDSWSVPCPACHGAGKHACAVCGFAVEVAGYDCLVCDTVNGIADAEAGDIVVNDFAECLARAIIAKLETPS
jgi:DnaJ-class molecular chaperone